MRLEKEIGTLEPGKFADVIVVDGNPLDDISMLEDRDTITHVMKGGQFFRRPGEAPFMRIPPGTRVVRFAGEAPHHVQEVQTATTRIRYSFAAGRMAAERLHVRGEAANIDVRDLVAVFKDFNEDLRQFGPGALSGWLKHQLAPDDARLFS